MTKIITSEKLTRRRMFSLLGAAAALGFATPTVVMVSDAEAQTPATPATPATTTGTPGMQRRQERRTGRHDRREDRRTGRTERREDRRTGSTTGTTTPK